MDRRDSESLEVFDDDKFTVWKYHMKICFEDKDIMPILNGTVPKPPNNALDVEKLAWRKANAQARCMINSSVSLHVLANLVNCSTAAIVHVHGLE